MNRHIFKVNLGLVIAFFFIIVLVESGNGQRTEPEATQPRTWKISNENAYLVLSQASEHFSVPLGMEIIESETNSAGRKTVTVSASKMEDVVNAFVSLRPEYRWYYNGGSITLVPTILESESLLDTILESVDAREATPQEFVNLILSSEVVQNELSIRKLAVSEERSVRGNNVVLKSKRIFVSQKGKSIREILNSLLADGKISYWAFYRGESSNTIVLNVW